MGKRGVLCVGGKGILVPWIVEMVDEEEGELKAEGKSDDGKCKVYEME